jgi:cell division protein FtsB
MSSPRKATYRLFRSAFITLLYVFVCVSGGLLGLKAAYPFVTAARWRADNDDLERQLQRYRIQNQRDEREIKMLETPDGIARAARQLGYVQPGERRLRIPAD